MKSHTTTRNAGAHPWQRVVSASDHGTTGRRLTLVCGHVLYRSKSRPIPQRVRCTVCRPSGTPIDATGPDLTMAGQKREDALQLAVAVARLDARRDPLDNARWVYYAKETESTWSITTESMIKLGAMPDTEEAYDEWASSDNTGIERDSRRRW